MLPIDLRGFPSRASSRVRSGRIVLSTNEEHDKFIEQFWERRNPTPGAPNKFKEEHYRRLAYANEHFASGVPGWQTDRGHIYILYGASDELEGTRGQRSGYITTKRASATTLLSPSRTVPGTVIFDSPLPLGLRENNRNPVHTYSRSDCGRIGKPKTTTSLNSFMLP